MRPRIAPKLLLSLAFATGLLIACEQRATEDDGPTPPAEGAEKSVPRQAPSRLELANASYRDIAESDVILAGGKWTGAPYVLGGASAPSAGLLRGFYLTGDLDGDGSSEAAVVVWSNSGGSGTFDYLAIVRRDAEGLLDNIATVPLGDRIEIRDGEVIEGKIVLDLVEAGPEDAACCPGQKIRRTFQLQNGILVNTETEDQGRVSIADLEGVEWSLTQLSNDDSMPDGIDVTLVVDGDRISGSSGCNRYTGTVEEGMGPGSLSLSGPVAGTRMACAPPADAVEQRYLDALQKLDQFALSGSNLTLTWIDQDQFKTMVFTGLPTSD